jgi:anti-sigma-K factor RskA
MNAHLTDDDLIRRLYGVGEEDDHLATCLECRERWLAIQNVIRSVRAEAPRSPEISGRALAVQRRQILARLDRPLAGWRTWGGLTAAVAASLLAAALFLSRPTGSETPAPAATAVANPEADAQLFTDVYSMEQDVEPRAAAPIRGLFQETSFESAQEARQ